MTADEIRDELLEIVGDQHDAAFIARLFTVMVPAIDVDAPSPAVAFFDAAELLESAALFARQLASHMATEVARPRRRVSRRGPRT